MCHDACRDPAARLSETRCRGYSALWRTMRRSLWWSWGVAAVSFERGTPVVDAPRSRPRTRKVDQRPYLTKCIFQLVLESQLPHTIVKILFTITTRNIKLTVLWGIDFPKLIYQYIGSNKGEQKPLPSEEGRTRKGLRTFTWKPRPESSAVFVRVRQEHPA